MCCAGDLGLAGFYEDLVSIMVTRLGSGDQGSHQWVLADVLEHCDERDLMELKLFCDSCTFLGLRLVSPSLSFTHGS